MERKIDLVGKSVDIVSINCINPEESIKALEYSTRYISFKNQFLFTDSNLKHSTIDIINIKKIRNIHQYNDFILKLNKFIKSKYVLIVQDDGHVVNPNLWTDKFLDYDYIGAPWPNSKKWKSRWNKYSEQQKLLIQDSINKNRVGNGGFSLRSKKFLEFSNQFSTCQGLAEDIFLTLFKYQDALDFGIRYSPFDLALKFSSETPFNFTKKREIKNQNYDLNKHFGWHGKKFKNYLDLLDLKYKV